MNKMKDFNEKVVSEDIKAEVEKTKSRLIFTGIVLFMCLIGFWVRTCSKMPPEPNASVECIKAGGQWIPEDYKVIKEEHSQPINAYCSVKK
jgi:hypothetical protein